MRGGFGTPEDGFTLKWRNSNISKQRLGYSETVRQLQKCLETWHSSNRKYVNEQLAQAEKEVGSTVFDWLVEIINIHCAGGEEAEDGVELILE